MDAIKFIKEKTRMCKEYEYCTGCPLEGKHRSCFTRLQENPEESVSIVARWSEEHPQKTILEDFLEKYPKASLYSTGIPKTCWGLLYGFDECPVTDDCQKCWNRPLSEVE